MKETILDVLMYLFENYMDEEVHFDYDQEVLRDELSEAGFPHPEINKAFAWLESLSEQPELLTPATGQPAMRVYTALEMEKLDTPCRGFLLFLEQIGVLDAVNRELAIDRVTALETEEINLDQLKWVVLMVLFNQPGQKDAFNWMEDLVYNETSGALH
jgi:Smg protein